MPSQTPNPPAEARVRPAIVPNVAFPSGTKFEFPLADMQVGDSFVVPLTERKRVQKAVYNSHKRWLSRGRFVTKVEPEGVRVWRVS